MLSILDYSVFYKQQVTVNNMKLSKLTNLLKVIVIIIIIIIIITEFLTFQF